MAYKVMSMKTIAEHLNDITYTDYYFYLMLIARSIFKWNNLPNGIDEKWIEKYLFFYGKCLFFKDKKLGYMVTKCNESGRLNFYDEPTRITPYGTNYMGKSLQNYEECIVIKNNDILIPTDNMIQLYAYRLADITRTMDTNIHAQKTPIGIQCTEKQAMSMKKAYKQIENNEPVFFALKDFDVDGIKVLKMDAPIVFDKLRIEKHEIWNECMTRLGVNNANMNKRERLVADEVDANNEQIYISADLMLKARQKACEQINKLFGENISVELRTDNILSLEEVEDKIQSKGDDE